MVAKRRQCCRSRTATTATLRLLVGQNRYRTVKTDRENLFGIFQIGESAIVADIGPIATNPGGDHLAGLGMLTNITRQRQKRNGFLMIERIDGPAFREAGALGFLAFAALDIGAETACPCSDFLTGERIFAERFRFIRSRGFAIGVTAELARIFAFRIIGTADESTVFTEFQRQGARAAGRA